MIPEKQSMTLSNKHALNGKMKENLIKRYKRLYKPKTWIKIKKTEM